jgi:hypothetical protein
VGEAKVTSEPRDLSAASASLDLTIGGTSDAPALNATFGTKDLTIGVGVAGVSDALQKLLAAFPSGAVAWVPNLSLAQADLLYGLTTRAVGTYVVVDDATGAELAWVFAYLVPISGTPQVAFGLALELAVDLGGTPLFGSLLSGVRITDFGVTYATQDFASDQIVLPPDAPSPLPAVPSGLGLGFAVDAGGSVWRFPPPSGSPADATTISWLPAAARLGRQPGTEGAEAPRELTLYRVAAAGSATAQTSWFPVQKSIGPLTVSRVGVVASEGTLGLALDAELTTDIMSIQLIGFSVSFAPANVTSTGSAVNTSNGPTVGLDGLSVEVSSSSLQIAGSLARSTSSTGSIEYDGSLLIQIGPYGINAVGSYAEIQGAASLFVFGIARGEFGGPPPFFITGLAAGFGVNRALRLPTPDQVASYPLVAAAVSPGSIPAGAAGTQNVLSTLNSGGWVPPTLGEYWVAAGVRFTSFELIQSFAVLTVQFGKDLTLALLGVSALQLPTDADFNNAKQTPLAFVYAEVELDIVVAPDAGVVSIEALLTPNSYVLYQDCKLTGGVAFYVWFGSSPYAGDCVCTLGGYHPAFQKPSYYPDVPRLGVSWKIGDVIHLTGESYFALTPSCAMGGGRLALTFAAGPLQAWFTAQADFIMYWRPFHFDIDVSVSIGVSCKVNLLLWSGTITVELGESLEIWGPPFGGVAHISWYVISFDISFGTTPQQPALVQNDWSDFERTSLPSPASICQSQPAAGLQSTVDTGSATTWVFLGEVIGLNIQTAVPVTQVVVTGPAGPTSLPPPLEFNGTYPPVNVFPLAQTGVASTLSVCIAYWTGTDWQPGQPLPAGPPLTSWSWSTVAGTLPQALWGQRGMTAQPTLGNTTVPAVVGATALGEVSIPAGIPIEAGALEAEPLRPRRLMLRQQPAGGPGSAAAGDSRPEIATSINATGDFRAGVAAAANAAGLATGLVGGTLPLFAAEIDAVLTDPPMLGPIGSTGPPGQSAPAGPAPGAARRTAAPAAPASPAVPVLRALFRCDPPAPLAPRGAPRAPGRASWTTATLLDLRTPKRRVPNRARPRARILQPGMTAIWDVPPGKTRSLSLAGESTLWIVAIDAAQRLLQAAMAPPGETTWPLAAGTRRVAVTALNAEPDAPAAGWHSHATLRMIASQTLLGDLALVRPQAPADPRRRRYRRGPRRVEDIALVAGGWMVDRNRTQGAGRIGAGWVETHLPPWCRTVAIGLIAAADSPGAALRVAPRVWLPGLAGEGRELRPHLMRTFADRARLAWRFDPPTDSEWLVVRASAPDGWSLAGVIGLRDPAADWARWPPEPERTAAPRSASRPSSLVSLR